MASTIVYPGYTDADIAGSNGRLSRCRHCGGDCFYLVIFKDARTWWHENIGLDFGHRAQPLEGSDGHADT